MRRRALAARFGALAACLALALATALAGSPAGRGTRGGAQEADPKPSQTPAELRKAQLAADSAKLLQLASELKVAMDKTTKDQLSIVVVKKADEVEKLAHKVREEMKAAGN